LNGEWSSESEVIDGGGPAARCACRADTLSPSLGEAIARCARGPPAARDDGESGGGAVDGGSLASGEWRPGFKLGELGCSALPEPPPCSALRRASKSNGAREGEVGESGAGCCRLEPEHELFHGAAGASEMAGGEAGDELVVPSGELSGDDGQRSPGGGESGTATSIRMLGGSERLDGE